MFDEKYYIDCDLTRGSLDFNTADKDLEKLKHDSEIYVQIVGQEALGVGTSSWTIYECAGYVRKKSIHVKLIK